MEELGRTRWTLFQGHESLRKELLHLDLMQVPIISQLRAHKDFDFGVGITSPADSSNIGNKIVQIPGN